MRWSRCFIPTLRDDPSGGEAPSHRLMLRAGMIQQLGAGLYSYLSLGTRVLAKIERIVREEMDGIGALELRPPALHPAEIWKESGRWDEVDQVLFRLRDRRQAEMALEMTAEGRQVPIAMERPGVKFRDSDLIGIPLRIVLGSRSLARDKVELVWRETHEKEETPLEGVSHEILRRMT